MVVRSLMGILTLFSGTVSAKDFGVQGEIAPIEEIDPRVLIQQKLKAMEDSGELQKRQDELKEQAKTAVKRPHKVEGITKATKTRVFEYDPTYTVQRDLKDHQGQVFARKGDKVNPLETVSMGSTWLFIDGDDETQVEWLKTQLNLGHSKVILVSGAPLDLSEALQVPVYFDQGGNLTSKLKIKHVPASVQQDGLTLKITEFNLNGEEE